MFHRCGNLCAVGARLLSLLVMVTATGATALAQAPADPDSSLERSGFELPVPRENCYRSESSDFVYLPETVRVSSKDLPTLGTEVSNSLPSSAESCKPSVPQRRSLSLWRNAADKRRHDDSIRRSCA